MSLGKTLKTLACLLLFSCGSLAVAEEYPLSVAAIFADHMVLQQGVTLSVWGTAPEGGSVTVTIGKTSAVASAGQDGKWTALLSPLKAGGPFEMTISSGETLKLADVMVGEV